MALKPFFDGKDVVTLLPTDSGCFNDGLLLLFSLVEAKQ